MMRSRESVWMSPQMVAVLRWTSSIFVGFTVALVLAAFGVLPVTSVWVLGLVLIIGAYPGAVICGLWSTVTQNRGGLFLCVTYVATVPAIAIAVLLITTPTSIAGALLAAITGVCFAPYIVTICRRLIARG